jgi:prepilin peptidase CpaA
MRWDLMTLIAAIAISSIAAATDIRSRRIPNWLTYSGMLLGVGYHTTVNGAQGFFFGAGGLFLGLALLIVFYLAGGMGAGDVKLMGAVGALLGPKGVFITFIFTALVGGIYAILLLLLRFRVSGTVIQLSTMFSSLRCGTSLTAAPVGTSGKTTVLNYGVAIAIGVVLSIIWKLYG